jgi:hypothetical protein
MLSNVSNTLKLCNEVLILNLYRTVQVTLRIRPPDRICLPLDADCFQIKYQIVFLFIYLNSTLSIQHEMSIGTSL